jgi:hypothetical protein
LEEAKRVRLILEVYLWLESHQNIATPEVIISAVLGAPASMREYYEANRFAITLLRKVGNSRKKILIRVEETDVEFVVLVVHAEDW